MTRRIPCSTFRIAAASALAMVVAHAARAQDAADAADTVRLPELTITGGKRDQDVMRVDGTIRSAGPETFDQRGILSVDEVDRVFPGMLIRPRSSVAYGNVTIRGQTSSDFYNPSVQVLMDGLPQDFALLGQLLPMQIDRVDVLYGPQGTLYGAGAVGGVINIVTRRPDDTLRLVGDVAYSNRQASAGALASGPIVPGVLYGDIALRWREQFGNYYPPTGGDSDYGATRDMNGLMRLRYAPEGSPWDVMVTAGRMVTNSTEEQFVFGTDGINSRVAQPLDSHYRLSTTSLGLIASYDLGPAVISSLTGWQDRNLDRTIMSYYTPETQRMFTQELRIASAPAAGGPISYVAGLWYQNLDFQREIPGQTSTQTLQTYAGYGEVTWHITDRLDVTGGLRFDVISTEANAEGIVSLHGSRNESALTPKIAIGYMLTDELRLYALYSSGFKPGGFTRTVTPYNFNFMYSNARTDNIEAGIRARLPDGRLEASAAVYYAYTRGYQAFVGAQPFQHLQNVGDVESYGFDARITVQPIEGLRIEGSLALNNAEYVKYQDQTGLGVNYEGNRPAYAPQVTAGLDISYAISLPGDAGSLIPRFGLTYVSQTYFDEANTVSQGAYTLYDASLSWATAQNLTATIYGNNLANTRYATYGFSGGPAGNYYQLGMGREIGFRLTASY